MGKFWNLAAAVVLVACAIPSRGEAATVAKVGKPAPPATITLFDKRKVALADLRGKVVVINHWATWCGPCKAEMPMMSAFHARYKQSGFEIFGVTTDDSLPAFQLRKLAGALSYPLSRGISGSSYPFLGGLPTSYVIDRSGIVRYAKAGSFQPAEFAQIILPLLREPAP
ncbi:MAG TPA: TlpA disulfide reductase family protein [Allosphingosinicella sp.]|jgi:thiol-disulfide isomerase/thioredoxin